MTVAATSREAYHEHQSSGKLGDQELKVLHCCMQAPNGLTRNMIAERTKIKVTSVCGRVNKLLKLGYLTQRKGPRCPVTNGPATWVFPVPQEPVQQAMGF